MAKGAGGPGAGFWGWRQANHAPSPAHLCGQQGLGIRLQLVQVAVLFGQAVAATAVVAGANSGGGGGGSGGVGGGGHWMRGTGIRNACRFCVAAVQRRMTLGRRKPLPPGLEESAGRVLWV